MTLIASLLLALAAVATLCLMPAVRAVQRLTGPDAAGAELTFLFLCAPRWLATAAVLCVLIARGSFGWIPGGVVVEACAVLLTHTAAGVVCGACLVVVRERIRLVTAGLWTFAIAMPSALIAYAAVALASGATPPLALRAAVALMPLVTVIGLLAGFRIYRAYEQGGKALHGVVVLPGTGESHDGRIATVAPAASEGSSRRLAG